MFKAKDVEIEGYETKAGLYHIMFFFHCTDLSIHTSKIKVFRYFRMKIQHNFLQINFNKIYSLYIVPVTGIDSMH